MAKSVEDRVAYLEQQLAALREALAARFPMVELAPFDPEGVNALDPYESMTVAELRKLAADRQIELNGARSKSDIIDHIKAVDAEPQE